MNRRIVRVGAGLALLGGCSGEPGPAEITPTPTPAAEAFDQSPLLDKPLLQIGGVTVICVGIEGLNEPYSDSGCADAAQNVSAGFSRIAEATQNAIAIPTVASINVRAPLRIPEAKEGRCSQQDFIADGFTDRLLKTALAVSEVKRIISQTPHNALHIVSESPLAKTCGDEVNRTQARYMRGQPNHPVVQFTGEGQGTDIDTGAHEYLHRRLGHMARLAYVSNRYYAGEILDGTEKFILAEPLALGPTIMGDRTDPYLSAFQQLQLGVIGPGQVAMPTTSGEITLESSQSNGDGLRLLTLPLKHQRLLGRVSFIGLEPPRYWLEHMGGNEVAVMVASESPDGRQPDQPAILALLHAGQPLFIDSASGISVLLEQINEAQAKLKVEHLN